MKQLRRLTSSGLIALCFVGFCYSVGANLISPIVPIYVEETFSVSITEIASVLSIGAVVWIVLQPFLGGIADRYYRKPLLAIGWILSGISCFFYALVKDFRHFLVFRMIMGSGIAFSGVAERALIVDIGEKEKGKAIGTYGTITGIGSLIAPVLGGLLAGFFTITTPFFIGATIIFIATLLLIILIKEPPWAFKKRELPTKFRFQILQGLSSFIRLRNLLLICLIGFISEIGFAFLLALLPVYAKSLGASEIEIGFIFPAYFVLFTFMQAPIGTFSDKYGRKPILTLALIGSIFGFLMFGLAESVYLIILGMGLLGLALGSVYLMSMTMVADIAPVDNRAMFLGISDTLMDFGFIAGPIGLGLIADLFGFRVTFFICSAILLASLIITSAIIKETKHSL